MDLGMVNTRKVLRVYYNWFSTTENGDEWSRVTIGENNVEKIEYHEPVGEGDRHFVDVHCSDGSLERIFNINSIEFEAYLTENSDAKESE